jgi:hypothetical protein
VDLIVRNVDPVAVKKMDELAKEKGISRQEFLKGQLETLAFFREQTDRELHLQNLVEKNILMMQQCHESMEQMNRFIEMMTGEEDN